MLLVFSLPIGLHHVFVDPEQAAGWKLMHALGTFLVAAADAPDRIHDRGLARNGGPAARRKGLLGWIGRLPWSEPVALGRHPVVYRPPAGGFGGLVNASYAMDAMVHNTAWITAHFHLILGGTVVTAYFAGAYALWPKPDRPPPASSRRMAVAQLWMWFLGILPLTVPWHYQGRSGCRAAWPTCPTIPGSSRVGEPLDAPSFFLGGAADGRPRCFSSSSTCCARRRARARRRGPAGLADTLTPVVHVPPLLNGFKVWNWLLVALMALTWAYPIGQFFLDRRPQGPRRGGFR